MVHSVRAVILPIAPLWHCLVDGVYSVWFYDYAAYSLPATGKVVQLVEDPAGRFYREVVLCPLRGCQEHDLDTHQEAWLCSALQSAGQLELDRLAGGPLTRDYQVTPP